MLRFYYFKFMNGWVRMSFFVYFMFIKGKNFECILFGVVYQFFVQGFIVMFCKGIDLEILSCFFGGKGGFVGGQGSEVGLKFFRGWEGDKVQFMCQVFWGGG